MSGGKKPGPRSLPLSRRPRCHLTRGRPGLPSTPRRIREVFQQNQSPELLLAGGARLSGLGPLLVPQVAQGGEEPRPAPRGRSQRRSPAGALGAEAGSREPGAGSRAPRAGSREPGAARRARGPAGADRAGERGGRSGSARRRAGGLRSSRGRPEGPRGCGGRCGAPPPCARGERGARGSRTEESRGPVAGLGRTAANIRTGQELGARAGAAWLSKWPGCRRGVISVALVRRREAGGPDC